MSLLTICQNVADEVGALQPSAIVGSSDDTAKRLLALAQRAGKLISARHDWAILQTEHTFATVSSDANYSLPSDYDRLIDGTAWDTDAFWSIRGPMGPAEWQRVKSGLSAPPQLRKRFRIYANGQTNEFWVQPTPTAADNLLFEYVSDQWCKSSGGTGQNAWAADTDVGKVSEELVEMYLIWRMERALGQPHLVSMRDYEDHLSREIANDAGGARVAILAAREIELPAGNVPDSGFG